MNALLFGSLSTIADTSELQRKAFNRAFDEHSLDWHWDRPTYLGMLGASGGRQRVASYAASLGEDVDAAAVHRTKSRIFQEDLATADLALRPGVLDTLHAARSNGLKVAWVTTTSRENTAALLEALGPDIKAADFDLILDDASVTRPKPDPAAYDFALQSLDERAADCLAIEDNEEGARSAAAAGVTCVAFPNENTADQPFDGARDRVDRLDFDELAQLMPRA